MSFFNHIVPHSLVVHCDCAGCGSRVRCRGDVYDCSDGAWPAVFQVMKAPDLKDRLEESEKLMKEMSKTWEEKLAETERIHAVSTHQDSFLLDKCCLPLSHFWK